MHVYRYPSVLKALIDGLPNPKGSLSTTIPSAAIASANREDRHLAAEFGAHTPLPVTVQRIDVVTSRTASHRLLFHADGTITQCAYNLWRMYNDISHKIIFV